MDSVITGYESFAVFGGGGSELLSNGSNNEVFALRGCYFARVASCLPTFRDILLTPYSGVKEYIPELIDTWKWNRNAVSKHRYTITNVTLLNFSEQWRPYLWVYTLAEARNLAAAIILLSLIKSCCGALTAVGKGKGKGHPCIGTEVLYRPYGP
jgi:hypothetical protein